MADGEESLSSFRARLLGSAISTYTVCMLVVPLKLWCRVAKSGFGSLGWDDALCVVALVFANAFFYIGMLGLGPDLGKHVGTEVTIPELKTFLEFLLPEQLIYLICIAVNKYAILAMYWRLFSVRARIPILVMIGVVSAWLIGLFFGVVFSCKPIAAQWDPTIPDAKCSGLREIYVGGSVPNIITDILLLMMPIRYVWRLSVPVAQRLMLGGIFMLGCFVSVVSIVRLVNLMRVDLASPDYTWKMKEVLLWSVVEVNVGLICACLPSMKPAIRLLGLHKLLGSSRSTGNDLSGRPSHMHSPAFGVASDRSKPRKKGSTGGMFSSIAGLTKLDDEEEDSFQMINKAHGTVETKVGPTSSVSSDGHSGPEECRGKGPAVVVKRDWSVIGEPDDCHHVR